MSQHLIFPVASKRGFSIRLNENLKAIKTTNKQTNKQKPKKNKKERTATKVKTQILTCHLSISPLKGEIYASACFSKTIFTFLSNITEAV
mgnify:CR=1 FL=1